MMIVLCLNGGAHLCFFLFLSFFYNYGFLACLDLQFFYSLIFSV